MLPLEPEQNQTQAAGSAPAQPSPGRSARKPDKDGYYRLGRTTLYYFLFKYGIVAIVLFFVELLLLGAASGGNNLPPFSEWVSADRTVGLLVRGAAGFMPIAIVLAALVAVALACGWYFSFRYKIEDNDLSFEKGIVGIQEISVPFRQIQNVDIEQSLIYRIFSLADLIILTAGHEDPEHMKRNESEIIMPALNLGEARRLQHFLLDRTNVQRVVAESPAVEPATPPPLE